MRSNHFSTVMPALVAGRTSFVLRFSKQGVDGRDEPGHEKWFSITGNRCKSQIAPVRTAEDLAAIVTLFRVYATSLDVDLSYQNFELEMPSMPGKYAPPAGELLSARDAQDKPIGCVGLRPIETEAVAR